METFSAPRGFVKNSNYHEQRQEALCKLDLSTIDPPIIDIVRGFSKLNYCFTLQSCYGHFLYPGKREPDNIEPLPVVNGIKSVEYRIAYLAICIEDSIPGKELFDNLGEIPSVDREYIQFGSADWFWERQLNSYALQVEPMRYMTRDVCRIDYGEALHIEKIRNQFIERSGHCFGNDLGMSSPNQSLLLAELGQPSVPGDSASNSRSWVLIATTD